MAVVSPEIKTLSLDLVPCSNPKCDFSVPTHFGFPAFPGALEDPFSENVQPPWLEDLNQETTATPSTPQPPTTTTLPPGTYFVNTKVCFRVCLFKNNINFFQILFVADFLFHSVNQA